MHSPIPPSDTLQAPILQHADSPQALRACFALMCELRPHLTHAEDFVDQVTRQAEQNYRLLAAWEGEDAVGLAGYRLQENLMYGRFLYVDDLVTRADRRSHGIGAALLGEIQKMAHLQRCRRVVLDTGLGNALAQRFYYRQGLLATGMHFSLSLATEMSEEAGR